MIVLIACVMVMLDGRLESEGRTGTRHISNQERGDDECGNQVRNYHH